MTRKTVRASRRDGGAVTLELAIVLPVLVFLPFGIIDVSRLFNAQIQLSQAAREGARIVSLAASNPAYQSASFVQARARAAAPAPAFTANTVTATVDVWCRRTSDPSADVARVTVSFSYRGILWPPSDTTYSQTAEMRCAG